MNGRSQGHGRSPAQTPDRRRECHCLIHHPQTPQEQRRVEEALEYARRIGDAAGIEITLAQLSGPCPAWGDRRQDDAHSS